jgi:nicotinamide mononucleotide transporter
MINLNNWILNNYIEVFGAITGIIYVILEIRQSIWLWPVGIVTSAVYIWVFYSSRFYADGSLQVYYLIISVLGWYWWMKGTGHRAQGAGRTEEEETERRRVGETEGQGDEKKRGLVVTRLKMKTGIVLAVVFLILYFVMWLVLSKFTNSPVPGWDSFITSLSIVATWMLARKIYEHWYLWIIVNSVSSVLFLSRGLYPTMVLYIIYCIMSFSGMRVWKKSI